MTHLARTQFTLWLALCVVLVAPACGGGRAASGDADGTGGDGGGDGDGSDGTPGGGGSGPVMTPGACKLPDAHLLETRVWRLSPRQIANTLEKAFGVTVDAATLPVDGASVEKYAVFDTFDTAVVHEDLALAMAAVAETAAKQLVPRLTKEQTCLGEQKPASSCGAELVAKLGAKAFRRPLDDDETSRYTALFDGEAGKRGGASATGLVIEAMLQSPRFLYRTELGPAGATGKRLALTAHEVASQLSYLLADEPPDQALLAAAAEGKLKDAKVVREHAARLVDGANVRKKWVDFFQQLVAVKDLPSVAKDATLFPEFSAEARTAMIEETGAFVENTLFADKAPVKTLFTANFSYVNAKLAPIYGMNASGLGADLEKTTLPGERRGILSHPGVLATGGHPDGTSVTLRGLFIFQRLLCHEKPDPPPGAADQAQGKLFDPANTKGTQREHFEYAKKNAPDCMACHGIFAPLGLGLEQFDGIGRYRSKEFDKPLDTTVVAKGLGDGLDGTYKDTLELGAKLLDHSRGQECLVMQAGSFGFGRLVDEEARACEVQGVASKFVKGGQKFQDLLVELTQTDSFFHRQKAAE